MGKIDTDNNALLLRRRGDLRNVEQLTGEEVYAGDQHHGQLIAVFLDKMDNVFGSNGELAFARSCEQECVLRIEPVMNDL